MKKILLQWLFVSLSGLVYAQTVPPQTLSFEGKLEAIDKFVLPLKQIAPNGTLVDIVQYELTFSHELNPANKLKVRVTYDYSGKVTIVNDYPSGRSEAWDMKIGKNYHFQLTKVCINAQDSEDYTIYYYICIPQATDCSKVTFKTTNLVIPNESSNINDFVIYQDYLYKFKMTHTNKNNHTLERAGFRD